MALRFAARSLPANMYERLPTAVGRSNWTYAGNAQAARNLAVAYTLVQTAKAEGVDVLNYLTWVFPRAAACSGDMKLAARLTPAAYREALLLDGPSAPADEEAQKARDRGRLGHPGARSGPSRSVGPQTNRGLRTRALTALGRAYRAEGHREPGRLDDAERVLRQALDLFRAKGRRWGEANVLAELGELARKRARSDEAEALYRGAWEAYRVHGAMDGAAKMRRRLAALRRQGRGDGRG